MTVVHRMDVLRGADAAPADRALSGVQRALREQALELAREDGLVDAAYCYRIVALERIAGGTLHTGGEALHAPRLLPASGKLTALAFGVCTIGAALEARAARLFAERRRSLALALDALGNELLFCLSRRAQDRMLADARARGLSMAGELRAGDPGLALEAQGPVLRLAGARALGVELTRGGVMRPLKTTSMVLGVGLELPAVRWSRCDCCPSRARCTVARRQAAALA